MDSPKRKPLLRLRRASVPLPAPVCSRCGETVDVEAVHEAIRLERRCVHGCGRVLFGAHLPEEGAIHG